MARILVTGGAGYVGSHCVKAISAAGHTCVVFDNLSSGHVEFVRWGPLIEGDIRDAAALDRAFCLHRFDAVMHLAALAYVGESVVSPGKYYDVNVNGTRTLLDAMVRAGVDRIVFSSSCAVYGSPPQQPITEASEMTPVNPYGMTKLVCERMMDDFGRAYGLRSVRLRYFNAAGADPDGDIGEDHSPETHLVPLMLDAAAGRRTAIEVFGSDYPTSDGTAVRDYVHVGDLAAAHVTSLRHPLPSGGSLSLNLGTGRGVSVREMIRAAHKVTGRKICERAADRRPGDPAILVASADRASTVLGWRPNRSLPEQMLADAWRWHQKRFGSHDN